MASRELVVFTSQRVDIAEGNEAQPVAEEHDEHRENEDSQYDEIV